MSKKITKKLSKLGSRLTVVGRKDESEAGDVDAGSAQLS